MFFSFFRRCLPLVLVWFMIPGLLLAQGPDRDRYIVSFIEDGPGRAALRAAGARIELELPSLGAVAAKIPARALPGLMRNPNIEYIEQDVPRYPMAQTTPYGIPMVQADLVTYDGPQGVKVCIIDSGYNLGHDDLPDNSMVTGTSDSGAGDWFKDGYGHGSHVAGTITALMNDFGVLGVTSHGNIPLHIVRVFGDNGNWAYSSTLVAALDACEAANAKIVNMSLGGSFKSRSEDRAFGAAYNKGILPIAAAGNAGNTRYSYPASYNSVMSVAAIDSTMTVADFSQQNDQVEVAAPGVAVRSTVPMGTGTTESFVLDGNSYEAIALENSASGTASGPLVDCELGKTPCPGGADFVCLIQRGDISFAEKVANCKAGNGIAAVIYNNADTLFSGTLGETPSTIPAVGISGQDVDPLTFGTMASVTVSHNGDYAYFDGTSMATPHVSGVAALVWSQHKACTNQQVREALTSTALDLGPLGRDNAYGFGLVQALDANQVLGTNCDDSGSNPDEPPSSCTMLPIGASCSSDSACCSNKCKGPSGAKTCK